MHTEVNGCPQILHRHKEIFLVRIRMREQIKKVFFTQNGMQKFNNNEGQVRK